MVRTRISKGLGWIGFDRLSWKTPITADPEISQSPAPRKQFGTRRRDTRSTVEFRAESGVVEIHDPRLFRSGQESFCLGLVEEIVRNGLAQRAEIHREAATCRIEFEPGRFDRDDLAQKVASALKDASVRAQKPGASNVPESRQPDRWITITAQAARGRVSIWETLIDVDGQMIRQPHSASHSSKVSPHSKRPIRHLPRRARSSPPKARPLSQSGPLRLAEPIALANSPVSIFGRSSSFPALPFFKRESDPESKRMVNLALAGGSFAMAVAGVVLPGIPALPFLLLTGHYLVKSSPGLCVRLANVPGIGTWLRRASEVGGPAINRRSLLKMFGFTVAAVATFVILHPPLPIVILLETAIMAYYGFRELRKPSRVALSSSLNPRLALT